MSFEELQRSVANDAEAPKHLSAALQALWHDARGDWQRAHELAQDDHGSDGSWVHAYLHRKEGDLENASYWYTRAGRRAPAAGMTLEDEWAQIAQALVQKG